jgi:hypothetical protein
MSGKEINKLVQETDSHLVNQEKLQDHIEKLVSKRVAIEKRKLVASNIGDKGKDDLPFKTFGGFLRSMISARGQASSRRVIVVCSFAFVAIASLYVTFSPFRIANQELAKEVINDNYLIVLIGLGFITGGGLVDILKEKFKAQALSATGDFSDEVKPATGDGEVPVGDIPATQQSQNNIDNSGSDS